MKGEVRDDSADQLVEKRKKKKWPVAVGVVAAVLVVAGAGFWVWHEQPSFCAAMCHDTMGKYLETYEDSEYLVHDHAVEGVDCLDCHTPELSEQVAELQLQLSGNYRVPLAKMETDDEFCLREGCHAREEIESYTVTAPDGTEISPHTTTIDSSAAQMKDPHGEGGQVLECSTCHTSHRESKEVGYCYDTCHHTETFEACDACHE